MSHLDSGKNPNYRFYDAMETSVLEMLLRQDALQTGDKPLDIDEILYITEVLAEREKSSGNPGKTTEEALEDFKKNFLYPDTEEIPEEVCTSPAVSAKPATRPRWIRYAATAAAAIAFVFITSITAKSFGHEPWQHLYILTKDTFQFATDSTQNATQPHLQQTDFLLYEDFLAQNDFAEELLPMQLPESFVQTRSYLSQSSHVTCWVFAFEDGNRFCQISVRLYTQFEPLVRQRSDDLFEIREINGVSYYILSNLNQKIICWRTGPFECDIAGDFTTDEINDVLDSIRRNS